MTWSRVRLGEVADLNPREFTRPALDLPISFVPMADLDAEQGIAGPGTDRPFSEVSKGYTIFRDQDVLVAKITPCFENGKIGQAHLRQGIGVGSTEFHVVRPHADRLDPRYVLHYLRQQRVLDAGERRMTGSAGQRRVPLVFLNDLQIPLPPLAEQRRIAAILDQADALRAKRRQTLTLLDDLTQAIFLDMFGDPVTNPCGWRVKSLGDLGSLDRGVSRHRPRNDPALLGGPYPLIQTGDVANSGGYIRTHKSTYSELGLSQSKIWPAGTLCITIAANIAKTGILTFDSCFPDSVVGFTATPEWVQYVRLWFSFLQKTLERNAPQSAQKNINLRILNGLPVPSPPQELVGKFVETVTHVEGLAAEARAHQENLGTVVAALQSRSFTNEV